MEHRNLPIGVENFKEATRGYYVDKTLMIADLIRFAEGKSVLLTRPRRFGKSIALSMTDYFFNLKEESRALFADKAIGKNKQAMEGYLNAYPVVHLNMKGVEQVSGASVIDRAEERLCSLYASFPELEKSPKLSESEREEYRSICNKKASDALVVSSLQKLTRFLHLHYGKKAVLLIDEYDTPLESAYETGTFAETMPFFKGLYGDALKGNDDLYFALVSGVMQISKESLFSGLNNLVVASIGSRFLSGYFGFNKEEVSRLIHDYELPVSLEEIEQEYGGYRYGDQEPLFNPWSVLNFAAERRFRPYWANSGTNGLLREVIRLEGAESNLLDFFNSNVKKARLNLALNYGELDGSAGASLSFLAQAGYLSFEYNANDLRDDEVFFKIPNREIYDVFRLEVIGKSVKEEDMSLAVSLREAILLGDAPKIELLLKDYVLSSLSYYDLTDERNYHNAVTGILSVLFDAYVVKNEVNAGTGRCDIVLYPKDKAKPGIALEIKHSKAKKQLTKAQLNGLAAQALKQMKAKEYASELTDQGCGKVFLYGLAFWQKSVSCAFEEV